MSDGPMPPASPAPRVCLVGPLPPPAGGMANQCEQLARLLRAEGVVVELVRTNAPYRPAWVGRIPMLRALFRLLPYLCQLWRAIGRSEVVHVLANSGWAWHLLAAPALTLARWRGRPAIVNYRGGHAAEFFERAPRHVLRTLRGVALRVTPSAFLQRVFAAHGMEAAIIPNIIDLSRFARRVPAPFGDAPHLIVTRNLEALYDNATALRAFARVRERFPGARLTVAGRGPELGALQALSRDLGVQEAVRFAGGMDNAAMAQLYAQADCMLNPSTVDNMPISILESFASGVPVVSTRAGGIPDMLTHGRTGSLVDIGDDAAMAREALALLGDAALRQARIDAAHAEAQRYAWPAVRSQWLAAYAEVARSARRTLRPVGQARTGGEG